MKSSSSSKQVNLFLESRNARKRAEADVLLLANRLQHLRHEEERAKAKIEETRTRTSQILSLQARNSSIRDRKSVNNYESTLKMDNNRTRLKSMREANRKQIEASRNMLIVHKKKQAQKQREDLRKMGEFKEHRKNALKEANRRKTAEVRCRQEAMRAKRERERKDHIRRLQDEYAKRLQGEALRQQEAEALVLRMEEEENELIQRLQETQNLQRAAYNELANLLSPEDETKIS